MKQFALGIILASLLAIAFAVSASAQAGTVTVTLTAQNNSGQNGTATLTAMGDQTQVVVSTTGGPGGTQPEHIHVGTCPNVGAVKYPLSNLVDGKSTTVVAAPLSSLQTGGFAINIHQSPQQISVYTACGNIAAVSGAAAAPAATPNAVPATGAGALGHMSESALPVLAVLTAGLVLVGIVVRRRFA